MNLDEERKAFEREFKIRWEIGHCILKMVEFVYESQDYAPVNAVKQLSDEYYWVLALNTGWWAWQAAKAHEAEKLKGCVVVPVEPTQAMIDAVRSEHEGEPYLPYSLYKSFLKAATVEEERGAK